jgi:transposase-like protein
MISGCGACPQCGIASVRKNGRDRKGAQVFECLRCGRSFTALSGTPFSGYHFPPDVISLAVRWYLRYRLSYADVAEWVAERGVHVNRSTIYDWVQHFAPLYQEAARPHRRTVGTTWQVDETYVKVAGAWQYVYRAIDEHDQVIDVYVSAHRAADDAATFFRRAITTTGVTPQTVTTDQAAAYPPALAAVVPEVEHQTGKLVQQRIERDHQHLKQRYRPMRGFRTGSGAQAVCAGHGFIRNLAGGFYDLGWEPEVPGVPPLPLLLRTWEELTLELLAG